MASSAFGFKALPSGRLPVTITWQKLKRYDRDQIFGSRVELHVSASEVASGVAPKISAVMLSANHTTQFQKRTANVMHALKMTMAAAILVIPGQVLAQTQQEHQQHHPGNTSAPLQNESAPVQPQPSTPGEASAGQMMQGMPEQCRAMMQSMQSCMGMMQQMMQRQPGEGGTMMGPTGHQAAQSAVTKAYMAAAQAMHGPMMEGLQASDPDVAFVKGMIAHHMGAIEMAKVQLQFGKDEQAKKWANAILQDQQREIDEMQAWLRSNAR